MWLRKEVVDSDLERTNLYEAGENFYAVGWDFFGDEFVN